MSVHPMDTLTTAEQLGELGFDERKAKGLARIMLGSITDNLATKDDFRALKNDIRALDQKLDSSVATLDTKIDNSVERLEAKIDARGAETRTELKWIKIIGGTIVGLLILPWLAGLVGATLPGP